MSEITEELRDFAGRTITFDELGMKTKAFLGRKAYSRCMDVIVAGAVEMRNEIVLSMRNSPATGKLYKVGTNKRGKGGLRRASQPMMPPRPNTGDLIRSIIMDVRHSEIEIGSNITKPAYPKFLENGTKFMEPRPWLDPAVRKIVPKVNAALTKAMRDVASEYRQE
jgi:HK97 gp10 family phage protein